MTQLRMLRDPQPAIPGHHAQLFSAIRKIESVARRPNIEPTGNEARAGPSVRPRFIVLRLLPRTLRQKLAQRRTVAASHIGHGS